MKRAFLVLMAFIISACGDSNEPAYRSESSFVEIHDIFFHDTTLGIAVGTYTIVRDGFVTTSQLIMRSTDGGLNWTETGREGKTTGGLHSLSFPDTLNAWAAGDSGKIIMTTNGGITWDNLEPRVSNFLYSICFIDSKTGWAAGDSGIIVSTKDGGISWAVASSTAGNNYLDIYFRDKMNGWICGFRSDGTLSGITGRSTDGGATWSFAPAPQPSAPLNDLFFIDSLNGWASGDNYIINTTDGGLTWKTQWQGDKGFETASYESIFFTDSSTGYAAGWYGYNAGRLLRTTNGGSTWYVSASAIQLPLFPYSIYFTGKNTGWMAGGRGASVFKTTNAGNDWIRVY